MTTLTETTTRSLLLVRQLLHHGESYVGDTTDLGRAIAVQTADFAVEMVLRTLLSHFGPPSTYSPPERGYYGKIKALENQRNVQKMDFYRLWDEVLAIYRDSTKGIGIQNLPLRREINLLHKMRNDVQHNTIMPAVSEIRKVTIFAESFVQQVTLDAFECEIDQITLASLIQDPRIADFVGLAEAELAEEKNRDSIIASTKAFALMLEIDPGKRSFLPPLSRTDSFGLAQMGDTELDRAIEELGRNMQEIEESIAPLRDAFHVLALGGDLRRYLRFRNLSPAAHVMASGKVVVDTTPDWQPSHQDAIEVLGFVFDTALRWQ